MPEEKKGLSTTQGALAGHAAFAGLVALCGELKEAGALKDAALANVLDTIKRDIEGAPVPAYEKETLNQQLDKAWQWSMS
ncbi:hypothetical protein [Sphingomonas sp. OTU376]|uniref:hypothetical protein n=1 Tax=Sphingomonas sp. OTU376 TaxID=3043863 RepID=UPI00313A8434